MRQRRNSLIAWETVEILERAALLCHLSEAVAAPLSLPRRSEAKAGRGDSPKHGDSERIREEAPRRGYSAIPYFNSLLGDC